MAVIVNLTWTTGGIAPFIIFTNDLTVEKIRLCTWLQM